MGLPPLAAPPPLARQSQARWWNRIRHNFPHTQDPVARRGFRPATQILRAGTFLPGPRGNPRKWGPGKGDYEHKVLIWSRPRRRFAQSLVAPGEAQRSGFAGKRRSKGTNAVFAARRKRSGVDFATTSRRGQSHSPPTGGEILPVKRTTQRPDEGIGPYKNHSIIAPSSAPFGGTFPPRGRLFGGTAPIRLRG